MKIHLKVLIIILLVITVTGISAILIGREYSKNALEDQIRDHLVSASNDKTQHLATYLNSRKESVEALATQTEVFELMVEEVGGFSRAMSEYIMDISADRDPNHIFIINDEGNLVWGAGRYGLQTGMYDESKTDMNDWDIFIEGKKGTIVMDTRVGEFTENVVVGAASPFYLNKELTGVVVIIGGEEDVAAITDSDYGFGKTGEVYIVNKDGHIVTPSRFMENSASLKVDLTGKTTDQNNGSLKAISYKNYMGTDVIGVYSSIPETGWTIVSEISQEEAFAPISKLTTTMIWAMAILLVVGTIASLIISRITTRPIIKLHRGVDQIMHGNLDCRIENTGKDEIGQLSQAFNKMSDNLEKSQIELESYAKFLEVRVNERTAELEEEITERKNAQDSLSEKNQELMAIEQELRAVNQQLEDNALQLKKEVTERKTAQDSLSEKNEELTAVEEELRAVNQQLEERVYQRTVELADTNRLLRKEIDERKQAEKKIVASLKEKEVLLKEIHHRVKNNLQVISSLLYLQSSNTSNEEVLTMFNDSRNRVGSMALVHEKLYQSKDLAKVNFPDYIQSLTDQLIQSCSKPSGVELIIDAEDISLDIDSAIPCGLIINELLINAFKHAFPAVDPACDEDQHEDKIRIEFSANDEHRYTLKVSDNGIGIPEDMDLRNTESLGMQLVSTLTEQLEGILEINGKEGTEFKIEFTDQNVGQEVSQNG